MVCASCEARDAHEPGEWFAHIWFLHSLARGGYPFRRNDLTVAEWIALGELDEELKHIRDAAKAGVDLLK